MFSSLIILASAFTLSAAWPAVFYSDANCTSIVKVLSQDSPVDQCINTFGAQSYKGSLGSDKEELLIYRLNEECDDPEAYPIGVIDGSPQKCIFVYKELYGPFGAAKISPVEEPSPPKKLSAL